MAPRKPASGGSAGGARRMPPCTNNLTTALLMDTYQITMAYAYWKNGTHERPAAFDLLFRKNPFGGEFTVFAGLEECLRFVSNFRFTDDDLAYLKAEPVSKNMEPQFFEHLKNLDCASLRVYAQLEGSVVFPRVPLLRVEGPLMVVQLIETTLLNLVNYASLVATNAARHRLVAGNDAVLLEFGLRRAQGPDGGVSASRYAYLGGFDATSNLEAGRQFGIPVRGTHAHSYVQAHVGMADITQRRLAYNPELSGTSPGTDCPDFVALVYESLDLLNREVRSSLPEAQRWGKTNESELAAFASYALAFPSGFLALVDTYDVLKSGVPNFLAVALALRRCGYNAVGIRLDSGDLSYLSLRARETMRATETALGSARALGFGDFGITASNDIHEEVLHSLKQHGHAITAFGIGTHLVTCLRQPALGCVYKLVEIDGAPRIKLSEDVEKVTIPGRKRAFRLYTKNGPAVVDVMLGVDEAPPEVGERILCRHAFVASKRAYVQPARVENLHHLVWDGKEGGVPAGVDVSLAAARERCGESIKHMRSDHLRYSNPTPYKVSVSEQLFNFIHKLWLEEAPVGEIV
jgi:nicotinate phosphoribosyltransferase